MRGISFSSLRCITITMKNYFDTFAKRFLCTIVWMYKNLRAKSQQRSNVGLRGIICPYVYKCVSLHKTEILHLLRGSCTRPQLMSKATVPFLKIDIYLQNSSPYEFCKYRCRMHDTQLYVHNNQFITALSWLCLNKIALQPLL